ncbi:CGNR zinc finger domain-containing protein [Methylophaga sp.]|uniref:CGNR zinc finger domain-containing protein n=1 Tax=Methylophaga sp. TaxID=2024840 RepID=UPI003A916C88
MTNARNITRKPIVIADHPVLDMLNTVAIVNKQQDDFWQTDEDVIYWLETVANIKLTSHKTFKQGELLKTARLLREVIRKLVVKKKGDSLDSIKSLEPFLDASLSWVRLQKNAEGQWQQHRCYKQDKVEQVFAPITEAAAALLAEVDFNLVRVCEHEECILWFLDRTKTHKRRWCSMALCGNRHKVAKYRKQKVQ